MNFFEFFHILCFCKANMNLINYLSKITCFAYPLPPKKPKKKMKKMKFLKFFEMFHILYFYKAITILMIV